VDENLSAMSIDELVEAAADEFDDDPEQAELLLDEVLRRDPVHLNALFDRGLIEKRRGEWLSSISFFERYARIVDERWPGGRADVDHPERPEWWNIGIAATALRNWPLARQAWIAYGIKLSEGSGEIIEDFGQTPVRIFNDEGSGEVVWGRRLCPARVRILNVPFPAIQHRYGDIVLHDGVPNGERVWEGKTFSVFDELEVWSESELPTTIASISGFTGPDDKYAFQHYLVRIELPHEDWSNVRMLCRKCSESVPAKDHSHGPASNEGIFGFAAEPDEVEAALNRWASDHPAFMFTIDDTFTPGDQS
jgi:hypothetical protein